MTKFRKSNRKKSSSRRQIEEDEFDGMIMNLEEREKAKRDDIVAKISIHKDVKPKNVKQKELIKAIHDNQIVIVKGSAGTGKAQPLEEPVLTPNGFVRMGSLKVGDDVISVDGKPTSIIGVFPQGEIDVFRIEFSDGSFTECSIDHLWFTETYKDRLNRKHKTIILSDGSKKRKYYRNPKPGSVKTTKEIIETLKVRNNSRLNHSIPLCCPVFFESKKLPIDPYIMGILLGDGCMKYGSISFSTSDEQVLEQVQNGLLNTVSIKKRSKYDYFISRSERVNGSNYVRTAIKDLGLAGLGSEDKFIPESYLINSFENRLSLLQGLMDSDGYADKNGVAEFCSSSKKLAEAVTFLVQSIGGTARTRLKKTKFTNKYGKKVEGKLSYIVTINLSNDIKPFRLERKLERYKNKTKYFKRYIKDIKFVGKKECQCIMVDHDSSLYITRNFIVTHNTFIALKAALEVLKKDTNPIDTILLTKPIVEAGESIGFLPGDVNEKTDPYMKSFQSNIEKLVGKKSAIELIANGIVKSNPIPFMRGDTFSKSIAIIDEAQNTTKTAFKLIISRIGNDSKMVILGDSDQTDLIFKGNEKHGLEDAFERLQGVKGIAFVEFTEDDIVRSEILIEIMKRYKKS